MMDWLTSFPHQLTKPQLDSQVRLLSQRLDDPWALTGFCELFGMHSEASGIVEITGSIVPWKRRKTIIDIALWSTCVTNTERLS